MFAFKNSSCYYLRNTFFTFQIMLNKMPSTTPVWRRKVVGLAVEQFVIRNQTIQTNQKYSPNCQRLNERCLVYFTYISYIFIIVLEYLVVGRVLPFFIVKNDLRIDYTCSPDLNLLLPRDGAYSYVCEVEDIDAFFLYYYNVCEHRRIMNVFANW